MHNIFRDSFQYMTIISEVMDSWNSSCFEAHGLGTHTYTQFEQQILCNNQECQLDL